MLYRYMNVHAATGNTVYQEKCISGEGQITHLSHDDSVSNEEGVVLARSVLCLGVGEAGQTDVDVEDHAPPDRQRALGTEDEGTLPELYPSHETSREGEGEVRGGREGGREGGRGLTQHSW